MATRNYAFWDTVTFGTDAKTEHQAFQNRQGVDSTNDKYKTNSRGNGEFPANESFLIKNVGLFPDSLMTDADLINWMVNSYVEIQVSDQVVFQAPLRECVKLSEYGGVIGADATSVDPAFGIRNMGFDLPMPIKLGDGNSFRVLVGQGTALSTTFNVKVVLTGEYTYGGN